MKRNNSNIYCDSDVHIGNAKKKSKIDNESFNVFDACDKLNCGDETSEDEFMCSNVDVDDVNKSWNEFNKPSMIIENNKINNDLWISPSSIKNYMMKDPIIDWIKLKNNNHKVNNYKKMKNENKLKLDITKKNNNQMLDLLFKMGIEFENKVFSYLEEKYGRNVIKIENKKICDEICNKTIEYMKKGVPIILHGQVRNHDNMTYGIPDILIRCDWINKIFKNIQILEHECTKMEKLNGNYHYRVIDIKWSTIQLCSNGKYIRNNDLIPAYKGQMAIYNAAIGKIQGYIPKTAYILGKGWKYEKNNQSYQGYDCFELLGQIDFETHDRKFINTTKKAIDWIYLVNNNWNNMTHASSEELYPNMNNKYDGNFHAEKLKIANDIGELTSLWMVGIENRKNAIKNGINTYYDKKCNADVLKIKGKHGNIINKIIKINNSKKKIVSPKIICNNDGYWKNKNDLDLYVDFETINHSLYDDKIVLSRKKNINVIIFLIGVGYTDKNNKWIYKNFKIKHVNLNQEKKIINDFFDYVDTLKKKYKKQTKIIHWGHIERTMLDMSIKNHDNENWRRIFNSVFFVDMCKVFIDEPICINGSKKFGLKDIASAMSEHKLININWKECKIGDGFSAMIQAIHYYHDKIKNKKIMNDIIKYNKIDCKTVYEIVSYLRNNHI